MGIAVVSIAAVIGVLIFRESLKDGLSAAWGLSILATAGTMIMIVAAGVLIGWGFAIAL